MSELTAEWFGPDDPDALAAWVELTDAVRLADAPWRHPSTLRTAEGRFRHAWDGEPALPFLARQGEGGDVVGWGSVSLSERDNTHFAHLGVAVHPERRGRGHGTWILGGAERAAREAGRTVAGLDGVENLGNGAFAVRRGYERVSAFANRRQTLADVDPAAVSALEAEAAAVSGDYDLERWPVPTSADRLDELAVMAAFINDAPTDELDVEDEVFDGARMRAYEDAQAARDWRLLRLVARHRATGALAGQTVVAVWDEDPRIGDQHDTTVVPAHRGHRLGLRLKLEMMRWLAEDEPQVLTVDTGNAVSNDFMISVNERLGYRLCAVSAVYQRRLDGVG